VLLFVALYIGLAAELMLRVTGGIEQGERKAQKELLPRSDEKTSSIAVKYGMLYFFAKTGGFDS
jgi:hypothetical protein